MTVVCVTPRMLATITAMQRFQADHGRLPSQRELLPYLGFKPSSVSSAHHRIVELERAGVINRAPYKERAYGFRPGVTVVCEYPKRKEHRRVQEAGLSKSRQGKTSRRERSE